MVINEWIGGYEGSLIELLFIQRCDFSETSEDVRFFFFGFLEIIEYI